MQERQGYEDVPQELLTMLISFMCVNGNSVSYICSNGTPFAHINFNFKIIKKTL